jgi:hypothetical protein
MPRRAPLLLPARLSAPAVKSTHRNRERDMDIPESYIDKFFFDFEALKVHSYV